MPMEEIWWFIFFDQTIESSESSMTKVFCIVDMPGRCMGKYQIRASVSPERVSHPGDETIHFFLGILIYPAIIPSAA